MMRDSGAPSAHIMIESLPLRPVTKRFGQMGGKAGRACDLTFPDYDYSPSELFQQSRAHSVPLDIPCQLREPIFNARARDVGKLASRVLMPKASMDLDDRLVPGKDDIGRSWKVPAVQPEAQAHRVQPLAHDDLWPRILLAVAAHYPRTRCCHPHLVVRLRHSLSVRLLRLCPNTSIAQAA